MNEFPLQWCEVLKQQAFSTNNTHYMKRR